MQITQITVQAGRVVNHPTESYANLRPNLEITADISPDDDADQCIKDLQAKAEQMVEDHKNRLQQSLIDIQARERREREITSLETDLRLKQSRLDHLRENPEASGDLFSQVEAYDPEGDEIPFDDGICPSTAVDYDNDCAP
ncbi:MAG: hypothetical protein AAGI03_00595 [Pseudomonadota bacterium]